jgi:hypothetical protein
MSNQFLNSESIFEVIGNYPVVDQFDVLYTNLQSGSYVDNYITGSLFTATRSPTGAGFTFSAGERGLTFSKLGVSATKLPSQNLSDTSRSYNLQPWRERAGTIKNLRIFSNSERFYDSLLPDLSKMAKTVGLDIEGVSNFSVSSYGNILTLAPAPIFLFTFPFEPLFSSIQRQVNLSKGFISTNTTGIPTPPIGLISKRLLLELGSFYAINTGYASGGGYVMSHSPVFTTGITPVNSGAFSSDVAKVIFGFGDANTYAFDLPYTPGKGYTHLPVFRSGSIIQTSLASRALSPIIRGWKYGVQDGNPHYTSCIFRRNKFGQFRDMLEQRVYPVSYLDYDNSPTRYFGEFETTPVPNPTVDKKTSETIEYPVTVTFVKQQTVTIGTPPDEVELLVYSEQRDRNQTWSSNLSTHATSSLPYFDLENTSLGRNRGEIPSSVINPEVVYTTI